MSGNSTTDGSTPSPPVEHELPEKARQLGVYLDDELATDAEIYVKSRFGIASPLDVLTV